jgi:hypothetical protein
VIADAKKTAPVLTSQSSFFIIRRIVTDITQKLMRVDIQLKIRKYHLAFFTMSVNCWKSIFVKTHIKSSRVIKTLISRG